MRVVGKREYLFESVVESDEVQLIAVVVSTAILQLKRRKRTESMQQFHDSAFLQERERKKELAIFLEKEGKPKSYG